MIILYLLQFSIHAGGARALDEYGVHHKALTKALFVDNEYDKDATPYPSWNSSFTLFWFHYVPSAAWTSNLTLSIQMDQSAVISVVSDMQKTTKCNRDCLYHKILLSDLN